MDSEREKMGDRGVQVVRSSWLRELGGIVVVLLVLGAAAALVFGPELLSSTERTREAVPARGVSPAGAGASVSSAPAARREITAKPRTIDRAAVESTVEQWKDRVVEGRAMEPAAEGRSVRGSGSRGPLTERRIHAAVERAIARGWLTIDPPGSPPSGMALFPPMGTQPIQSGIVVPEDFELPPGYVRHYQVSDEGERLPPILMFSPDYEWVDAKGERVPIPEDGIVPPDMAPPGLPIVFLEVPERAAPPALP